MADSTNVPQMTVGQAAKEATFNALTDALSPASFGGRNYETSSGLTWGYLGGRFGSTLVANGTLALTANTTNYIVALRSSGAISASTSITNWNTPSLYVRLYLVVTGASTVTSYEDHRQAIGGSVGGSTFTIQSQSANYTAVLADGNTGILHPSSDNNARTFTIPANGSVAYAVGTMLTFINGNGVPNLSIAITTDTMRLAGSGSLGTRTLAANGIATAVKIAATEWIISGTGLT
jgi:hypothetical protein